MSFCHKMPNECMNDPFILNEGSRYKRNFISSKTLPNDINGDSVFTVASYNVLSQHLLDRHPEHYVGIKQDYLTWKFRSDQIIEEIVHFMPDIVCLQEVHHSHYRSYFREKLNSCGYYGKYKQRPGSDNDDGCATFFNHTRFCLQETKAVNYNSYDGECDGRYNVALILVLSHKSSQRNICVANTHLLYNPKRGDIKLTQMAILMAEVDALKSKYSCVGEMKKGGNNQTPYRRGGIARQSQMRQPPQQLPPQNTFQSPPPQCAVLVCGDFNLVPYSVLHTFLTHGGIRTSNLMCSQLSGSLKPGQKITNRPLNSINYIPHQINMNCQFIHQQNHSHQSRNQQNNAKSNQQPNSPTTHQQDSSGNSNNSSNVANNQNQHVLRNIFNNSNTSTSINPSTLSHNLNLASAYPHLIQVATNKHHYNDMQVTQSHPGEVPTTVDYILYGVNEKRTCWKYDMRVSEVSKEGPLMLLKYLQLPVVSSNLQSIPNHVNGSDHLFIMAQFLLRE